VYALNKQSGIIKKKIPVFIGNFFSFHNFVAQLLQESIKVLKK
jgi:hypothetical protein